MFNKKNIAIVVVLVLVVAGVGFLKYKESRANSVYSVVYLSTGEVYVGKLTTFPDLQLKNAYILQVTKNATDPTKNDFQLQPISEALWAPSMMHFVKNNVVFYGPLLPTSKIAETIAGQTK